MPDSLQSKSKSLFVCDCEENWRSACAGERFYEKHEKKRYCVLHFPAAKDKGAFNNALKRKLANSDFDFQGVWFPEKLSFTGFTFENDANFLRATFNGGADFKRAHFKAEATFSYSSFYYLPVDFNFATFSGTAYFGGVHFEVLAEFRSATFEAQVFFGGCEFQYLADFRSANFRSTAYFAGTKFKANAWFSSAIFGSSDGPTNFNAALVSRGKPDDMQTDYLLRIGPLADFSSANFHGQATFRSATFNSPTDFRSATFHEKGVKTEFVDAILNSEVWFRDTIFKTLADFRQAKFNELGEADFTSARFIESDFTQIIFKARINFQLAEFNGPTNFSNALFSAPADFRSAQFQSSANFSSVLVESYFRFAGEAGKQTFDSESSLDLQFVTVAKPERVSFHALTLRPHWFVNADARKFDLTTADWDWPNIKIDQEIERLKTRAISEPHRLLSVACGRLAENAEENRRYDDASRFRYLAMDARRREHWRGFPVWTLSWWYWLASGYGERALQALCVLVGIWLLSGLLYNHVGFARWEPRLASESDVASGKRDEVGAPLRLRRALAYSAGVMTLQKPEPRPATTAAQTVVLLETILGPVQAALLALAIRRKFMR